MKNQLTFIITIMIQLFSYGQSGISLEWANQLGGNLSEEGRAICSDSSNNIYLAGDFEGSVDFDPGPNNLLLSAQGAADLYIQKLDQNGALIWAKTIGGTDFETVFSMQCDRHGNIILGGIYHGTVDFDPDTGVYNLTSFNRKSDVFILKLDSSGNFLWAKTFGGNGHDRINELKLDHEGNILLCGQYTGNVDFDPGPGVYNLPDNNLYILKLDSNANFEWAAPIETSGFCRSIAIDQHNNVYATGSYQGNVDFDPDSNTTFSPNTTSILSNFFVMKLTAGGNFQWAETFGGPSNEIGVKIKSDKSSNLYVTGSFADSIYISQFSPSQLIKSSQNGFNVFVLKLNDQGIFSWIKSFEGFHNYPYSLELTENEDVLITGSYSGLVDFNPDTAAGDTFFLQSMDGQGDAFLVELDSNGLFQTAGSIGGPNRDLGNVLHLDQLGDLYALIYFEDSLHLNVNNTNQQVVSAGQRDVILGKIKQNLINSLEQLTANEMRTIYFPNPSNGFLQFHSNGQTAVNISIYSLSGQLLYQERLNASHFHRLNLSLPSGIYLIQKEEGERLEVQKLIIQN